MSGDNCTEGRAHGAPFRPQESSYIVTWAIDVDAASHLDAARKALEIQRDPDSIATVFNVSDGKGSGVQRIDLQEVSPQTLPLGNRIKKSPR